MLDLTGYQGLDQELRVDSSEGQHRYLLISPDGAHIKVAPGALRLLKGVHAGRSFEAIACEFSEKGNRPVSSTEVESAYRGIAAQITGIVGTGAQRPDLPPGFWACFKLMPASVVERVAGAVLMVFHPFAALLLLSLIALTSVEVLGQGLSPDIRGETFWPGYGLFLVSLLIHEIGHAAACARYGARPSDIGFTFYLVYPAFYSDVTSAWRLKRWQRVVVDLGGMYLQFIALAIGVSFYLWTGWEPLKIAFLLSWYGALFSLNPVFKFDGYWMLADALGVTNLSQQPSLLIGHLFAKLKGKQPPPLPWPRWLVFALGVYTPLSLLVWGYFVWHLVPFLVAQTAGYPRLTFALGTALLKGGADAAGRQAATWLASTFVLGIVWFGVVQMLRAAWARARRWRQAHAVISPSQKVPTG